MPENIIQFPAASATRGARRYPPHPHAEPRRQPARQLRLPLRADPTLDQRIEAARQMVVYYEENAASERDPALKARYQRRTANWRRNLRALELEREAATAQPDLWPAAECGRPHTEARP